MPHVPAGITLAAPGRLDLVGDAAGYADCDYFAALHLTDNATPPADYDLSTFTSYLTELRVNETDTNAISTGGTFTILSAVGGTGTVYFPDTDLLKANIGRLHWSLLGLTSEGYKFPLVVGFFELKGHGTD